MREEARRRPEAAPGGGAQRGEQERSDAGGRVWADVTPAIAPLAAADPIATLVPNTQGSAILPAWLKIRRAGDTVAYWWTKDPTQGTPVFGGMEQLDDFAAKDLLVGVAASAAVPDTSVDAGFRFAHFRLVSLGN